MMAKDGLGNREDVGDDEQEVQVAKRRRALMISDWDSEACSDPPADDERPSRVFSDVGGSSKSPFGLPTIRGIPSVITSPGYTNK